MNLRDVQTVAWQNKLDKGFNTTDKVMEIALIHAEASEALNAIWKAPDEVGGEIADLAIFVAGFAEMCGVDLQDEVERKLTVNAARTYAKNAHGHLEKITASRPATVTAMSSELFDELQAEPITSAAGMLNDAVRAFEPMGAEVGKAMARFFKSVQGGGAR